MQYPDLATVLSGKARALARGPVALVFVEDEVEVNSTLRHHLDTGFDPVIALMPADFVLAPDVERAVLRVTHDATHGDDYVETVNKVIAAAPGLWLYYCFNAEYLFFPFCENRRVGEMLQFHAEERREAMLAYVVDLYAGDLEKSPNAVSLEDAHLDKSGYYALAREDSAPGGTPKERQLNFYGGLRWRYEEHIPQEKRKIDRIALFKAKPGLKLRPDHTFNDEEMNTYACPWHHNLTATVASFRAAKALKSNPGSTFDIHNFCCHSSTRFEWHSRQLLDLGLMEPGQWF
ncbi:MAG: hypothetical protein AAF686_06420 [Pseudomonadota bacterium]